MGSPPRQAQEALVGVGEAYLEVFCKNVAKGTEWTKERLFPSCGTDQAKDSILKIECWSLSN